MQFSNIDFLDKYQLKWMSSTLNYSESQYTVYIQIGILWFKTTTLDLFGFFWILVNI